MTTAQPQAGARTRPAVLGAAVRAALLATLAGGVALTVVAMAADGTSGAVGVALGTSVVCLFFGTGAVVLNLVAALAPAASLLVALMTYGLKVVLLGALFVALSRSGRFVSGIDERWLGVTIIAGTLVWLATQIFVASKERRPIYDLPDGPEADAR